MLRKRLILIISVIVIIILSVCVVGCGREKEIPLQNNSQPNQGVKNSAKQQFMPWEISHWEKIADGDFSALAMDPKNSNIIYAAICKAGEGNKVMQPGLWKSEDGGNHWAVLIPIPEGKDFIDAIYIDPKCSENIWISDFYEGVFFSSDGGITWKKDSQKDENDIFKMYSDSFNNKSLPVVYEYRKPNVNSSIGVVFMSLDSGKTWKRTPLPPLSTVSPSTVFPGSPIVDWKNQNVLYAFGSAGLFKSVKGKGNYEYHPIGNSLNTSHIYIDPQNTNIVYVLSYNYQAHKSLATFRSSDYGKTWEKIGDFYFNPLYPVLLMKSSVKVVKVIKNGRKEFHFLKELYVSLDKGKNWKLADLNLSESELYDISIGAKGIIYADTYKGLFKSVDKGLHWTQIPYFGRDYWNGEWTGKGCFNSTIFIDYNNPDTIYWASGLLKSTDGGKTWESLHIQHPEKIYGSTVLIDPLNHNVVYLGMTGINDVVDLSHEEFVSQGIYKSTDSGKTWKKAGLTGLTVSAIAVSPATGIVYVGTYNNGMFMSKDSGKTWQRIPLDNDFHLSVSSIAIDSENSIVYIGVLGGGIFKIKDGK